MTTFVSDNPGIPISDLWDGFYEQVHEDCEKYNFNPVLAIKMWTLGLAAEQFMQAAMSEVPKPKEKAPIAMRASEMASKMTQEERKAFLELVKKM